MRNKSYIGIFLVVLVIGIGAFGYWSYSKSELPDIIILGNPSEFSSTQLSYLPTGYKWVSEKRPQVQIDITDPKETRAYFVIDPKHDNLKEIIEWSKTSGKQEIYIRYQEPPDPNAKYEDFNWDSISSLVPDIDFGLSNLINVPEARADNVPGSNCTSGTSYPAGVTQIINCNSYPTAQMRAVCAGNCSRSGYTPSIEITYKYSAYTCHLNPMKTHIWKNVDQFPIEYFTYGVDPNPNPSLNTALSTPYCMGNVYNYPVHYCQPSGLTIHVYNSVSQMNNDGQCGSGAWGCANTHTGDGNLNDNVATSKDANIYVAQNRLRGNWWLIRHELQHTYGFTHGPSPGDCGDMDQSVHNVQTCCSFHNYN